MGLVSLHIGALMKGNLSKSLCFLNTYSKKKCDQPGKYFWPKKVAWIEMRILRRTEIFFLAKIGKINFFWIRVSDEFICMKHVENTSIHKGNLYFVIIYWSLCRNKNDKMLLWKNISIHAYVAWANYKSRFHNEN